MKFNESQKKIIDNIYGAYLISAPVGTGKTTVLTERIAKALAAGVKGEEILCLTFTNRAAEEMAARIKERVNKKEVLDGITIKTFHGFCAYFIKAEAKRIGIDPDFVIFDESEQYELMKSVLDKHPEIMIDDSKKETLALIEKLYKYRLNKTEIEIGLDIPPVSLDDALKEIDREYIKLLNEQNALDFNELVIITLRALYLDKKIKNKWSGRYRLIQIDEFQDTHLSEYLAVKELAKQHKNIAFIGDLDQTIYGWRGSEPFFIAKLIKKHFEPVKEFNLEINYRFDNNILGAVKSFLGSMENAATKGISAHSAHSSEKKPVDVFAGHNLREEIGWAIENIKSIREKEPNASAAILTRANYLVNSVAEVFSESGIAHITVDKYDFFRRREVKDLLAHLKIIFNKFDLESALRLAQRPPRNIGLATLLKIREKGNPVGIKISDFLNFKNYNFPEPFANLTDKWKRGRIIVLDTETTGTDVLKDDIIQIYAREVVNGAMGREFHFYLKNNIPVGSSFAVHGITDEFLKEKGRNPREVLSELKDFINNDITVGHNVNFDLSMISQNSRRNGIDFEFKEYYDTLDLSRRFIAADDYRLTTLSDMLGLSSATHDAKDDVIATIGLLEILVGKLGAGSAKRAEIFKEFGKKFIQLSSLIESWQTKAKVERPDKILKIVWEESGLKDFYEKDKDAPKRLASIETLKKIFKEKDDADKPADSSLKELIRYTALTKDINFLGLEKGRIPIVTVHQVKGLEFDYVFILGVNEFKFPIYKSDMEEEKRLFYVAMTRARKKIFISYSRFNDYGRPMSKSSFIDFIGSEFVNLV